MSGPGGGGSSFEPSNTSTSYLTASNSVEIRGDKGNRNLIVSGSVLIIASGSEADGNHPYALHVSGGRGILMESTNTDETGTQAEGNCILTLKDSGLHSGVGGNRYYLRGIGMNDNPAWGIGDSGHGSTGVSFNVNTATGEMLLSTTASTGGRIDFLPRAATALCLTDDGNATFSGSVSFKGDILTNVLGTSNTVFGKLAGAAIEAGGNYNLLMGENAGNDLTTGDDNVIIGYNTAVVATTMSDLVVIGSGAGVALAAGSTLADGTVLVGKSAGAAITTGQYNTAIGHTALLLEDVGDFNTAVGYNALASQTGGNQPNSNTAIGAAAGDAVTTGIKNVFVGKDAGGSTQLVDGTVCIGYGAGADVMTADADGTVAIGLDAGSSLTVGQYQTAIGNSALAVNIVGDGNTAIGYGTLAAAVSADGDGNNTAVGASAGGYVGTGAGNTAIGANAMLGDYTTGGGTNDIDGNNNTCVGAAAGMVMITTAHSNTFIGAYAGDDTTTGYENTCIGVSCDAQDATAHNQIVIGNNMNGTADNAVHIGNDTSHIRCDFNSDETWDASSDRRQKKDIECIDIGLDFINDLNPVKYRHKSPSEFPQEWTAYNPEDTTPMGGSNKYHWGFIAQEVKEVVDKYNVPDHNSWSVDPDGRQRVSKSSMTTILVKAVQELSAKVAELEAKLENQ